MFRSIVCITLGAVGATTLFLSCSDDSVPSVDAQAECMCPEAEPPLAGRIVHTNESIDIPANEARGTSAFCPEGGTLLGGGCELTESNAAITMNESFASPPEAAQAWSCEWKNPSNSPNTGVVRAICLVPPEE